MGHRFIAALVVMTAMVPLLARMPRGPLRAMLMDGSTLVRLKEKLGSGFRAQLWGFEISSRSKPGRTSFRT